MYADVQFVEKKICTLIALLEHLDTVAGVSVAECALVMLVLPVLHYLAVLQVLHYAAT